MKKVTFLEMTESDYALFLPDQQKAYAQERAVADHQSFDEALAEARRRYNEMLPEGARSPLHHFYSAFNEDKQNVGGVWLKVDPNDGVAWLYYILVNASFRGQGYGKAMMEEIKKRAKSLGGRILWLNVFENNRVAQEMYASVGMKTVARNLNTLL